MKRSAARLHLLFSVVIAMCVAPVVEAYTGDDPVFATGIRACRFSEVKAHIGPDNSVSYKAYGFCSGSSVSGQMAFKDGTFHESFTISNQAKIRTTGYCDSDPWATAVNCRDQIVQATGANVDPNLNTNAPLSLLGGNSTTYFRDAFRNASRPNPPGIPVNLSASVALNRLTAKWLAPDASGDRPFLGFLMQVRPQNAEGAAWVDLGRVGRHEPLDYRLSGTLPPTSATITGWDVRVCSTTALTASCTPAQTPSGYELATKADNKHSSAAAAAIAAAEPAPVKAIGRVKVDPAATPGPAMSICDRARAARARNSPAAPGLEAQCRAVGETPPPPAIDLAQLDESAVKGEAIASQDPLSAELRNQLPEGAARRGFDIGMGVAEGQTAPGPGKQRIHDALPADQQAGYAAAVAFSLERNANADFAAKGAAIAEADPTVAEARAVDADVFFQLGFNIATGIFGDPALGAQGNTATGPGSLKIRDSLSAAGQRGFNAAVTLHLARDYKR